MQKYSDFYDAHFDNALEQITAGEKETHWIWGIFPQVPMAGTSNTSQYYAINFAEAVDFTKSRLFPLYMMLVDFVIIHVQSGKSIQDIFGVVDAMKFHASITLMYLVTSDETLRKALDTIFEGEEHQITLQYLQGK